MHRLNALIVGNSRVERSYLQSALASIRELCVTYSIRGCQRALDRLSTGDIEVLFLLMSEQDELSDAFLSDLSGSVCSGVIIVPVCAVHKQECVRKLRNANIRTSHYFSMPHDEPQSKKLGYEVARMLNRPREQGLGSTKPELLCIVSSTGGPEALAELLAGIDRGLEIPVLVTQHMPQGFVDTLCQNLSKHANRRVHRALDGERIEAGQIYVAPGDAHLAVRLRNEQFYCALDQGPPSAGCRPAGNVMLATAAKASKGRLLAVCLTGMGEDGTVGMAAVRKAGGRVLVQDEASSVVWGMPGSIVKAGLANYVLPLSEIAGKINQLVTLNVGAYVSRAS